MANSLCKTSVLRIYQEVIEDVINGVRELFVEEGVDEQVLQELRQSWETKLTASKAVQNEAEEKTKKPDIVASNGFSKASGAAASNQQLPQSQPAQPIAPAPVQSVLETKMVPIQITLPPQPGTDGGQRVLTIQVPATALQGNQLQKVLTGPVITATMGLPPAIASSLLQQHVNAAFSSQQQAVAVINKNVVQTDGAVSDGEDCTDENVEIEFILPRHSKLNQKDRPRKKKPKRTVSSELNQVDGSMDTSDEASDGSEDDNDDEDLDDDKDDEDQEIEDEGGEEEPLNSEDDVSDDDPTDLFDTDNIVVCQYDKIIRNRNKWKFYLKDGIMNLNGLDFVFQKANGDAEW